MTVAQPQNKHFKLFNAAETNENIWGSELPKGKQLSCNCSVFQKRGEMNKIHLGLQTADKLLKVACIAEPHRQGKGRTISGTELLVKQ